MSSMIRQAEIILRYCVELGDFENSRATPVTPGVGERLQLLYVHVVTCIFQVRAFHVLLRPSFGGIPDTISGPSRVSAPSFEME